MEELTDDDLYKLFDEWLDECYETYKIGVLEFTPARILKECDETAYQTYFDDWLDQEISDENIIEYKNKYFKR